MGNALRNQPFHSWFPEHVRTSPIYGYNLHNAYKVYFYVGLIAVVFLLILPGVRGLNRCWMLLRVYTALWIGAVLITCNYNSWYGASICTKTEYKPHTAKNTPQEVQAEVGLHIGLRGINITLIEKQCESFDLYDPPFPLETIYYNEHFSWAHPWSQGRQDYGKHGGKFEQQYRAAKFRGVPYPITHIAEFFLIDGEQIRWYRKFRIAGWYTHIIMWTAFASHLFCILRFMVDPDLRKGIWQMAITGSLILLACTMYSVIILNDPVLEIHFPSQTLKPHFKDYYWVNLATGLGTFLIACALLILELMFPTKVAAFFNHSTTHDDSIFESDEEYESFLQKFARVSKRLSRRNNSSLRKRQLKRRTRQPSPPPELEDSVPTLPRQCDSESQSGGSRPTSVVYTYPEIERVSDSCCSSTPSSRELEIEIQIAQITIHNEDA